MFACLTGCLDCLPMPSTLCTSFFLSGGFRSYNAWEFEYNTNFPPIRRSACWFSTTPPLFLLSTSCVMSSSAAAHAYYSPGNRIYHNPIIALPSSLTCLCGTWRSCTRRRRWSGANKISSTNELIKKCQPTKKKRTPIQAWAHFAGWHWFGALERGRFQ